MSAPNLVNVSTITLKQVGVALGTTLTTNLLANAASSGKVFKITSIIVSNVDGTNAAAVSLDFHTDADGTSGTSFAIASTVTVPADASLVVLDKNTPIYLEEDRCILGGASAASDLECLITYEEIS